MSKLLVISGASRGIGKSTAQLFQASGYKVINLSRSPANLEGVLDVSADLSEPRWINHVRDELSNRLEGIDEIALVHNAGVLVKDKVGELPQEQLRRVLEVNVVASSMLNDLLIPRMPSGSSIIYLGSTLSEKAVPGTASYVTSKHAVVGLMRSTCQDLAGTGIHTACICPGFTDTEMLRDNIGDDPEVLEAIAGMQTYNRLVEPEEIAQAIFSVSQQPVFNGAVLHTNLGQVEN
ncbi:MAG TPA: short-chain dehydrogenase [Gammaproteobacteria bacterium]|jgi:3-oxoacyl-[acyl-carrier protein] reductase|nr:short-chain dehydrogenase [Gammaproteobacteria bacterium]